MRVVLRTAMMVAAVLITAAAASAQVDRRNQIGCDGGIHRGRRLRQVRRERGIGSPRRRQRGNGYGADAADLPSRGHGERRDRPARPASQHEIGFSTPAPRGAVLSADGALCADTGEFTGRSPKDKFTVRDATTDKNMWWAGNQSITSDQCAALYADFLKHAEGMTLFAQDLYGGAHPKYRVKARVYTEYAWHSLFIRTLLIRPSRDSSPSTVDLTARTALSSVPNRPPCRSSGGAFLQLVLVRHALPERIHASDASEADLGWRRLSQGPVEVHALAACTENMPSGTAQRQQRHQHHEEQRAQLVAAMEGVDLDA